MSSNFIDVQSTAVPSTLWQGYILFVATPFTAVSMPGINHNSGHTPEMVYHINIWMTLLSWVKCHLQWLNQSKKYGLDLK